MPVDVTSRYWPLASYPVPDGNGGTSALPARATRFQQGNEVYNHRLSGVESLEYLAWRHLGRSASWWTIADTNELRFPLDFRPGDVVRIPPADGVGRVVRTRSF